MHIVIREQKICFNRRVLIQERYYFTSIFPFQITRSSDRSPALYRIIVAEAEFLGN